jgi:branched-chain amino acid transport system substrate-binding protein
LNEPNNKGDDMNNTYGWRRAASTLLVAALAMSGAARAQTSDPVVAIGMEMTGTYAFAGVPMANGAQVAAAEINEANFLNGRKLKVVQQDNGSDKSQMITLVNRFAGADKALAIVGPLASVQAVAAAPIANQKHIVMLTGAQSPDVPKAGPWTNGISSPPDVIMSLLAKYAAETLKAKKLALLTVRDNDGYKTTVNVMRSYFKSHGLQIVFDDSVLASDTDFSGLATKLADAQPDAVFVALPAEQGASFVIQARQAGLPMSTPFLGPQGMASDALIRIGGSAMEGTVVAADYFSGSPSPANRAFVTRYQAMFHKAPDNWAGIGYTGMYLVANALKKAGPGASSEAVRQALFSLQNVPVLLGDGQYSYDANRVPHYGVSLIRVKDGKWALVTK